MPKLRVNQIVIEYDSFGLEDAEAILLISGLGTQMIRWSVPFCRALASRGYRVTRFDNRDAGLSTHLDEAPVPDLASVAAALARGEALNVPYTLFDMAGDTIGVLDGLSIEQAHIVGRSMGGMIAQLVASEHPHRTLSLTSIMSGSGNPENPPPVPEVMALLTSRAPHPSEDEVVDIRSTKLPSASRFLPRLVVPMIRRVSVDRSRPSPPPVIAAHFCQKSRSQRSSCMDRTTL
jgi:pimeloyl-ACP methyl ester carboxylesterase